MEGIEILIRGCATERSSVANKIPLFKLIASSALSFFSLLS